jgi:uncharacterized protein with von Willebrand factor type A (vWA) domain
MTVHPSTTPPTRPHFFVLLDRSGSMESMRADVIGGFNNLLAEQQADGDDARITVVQFDSQDPQEVLVDGARLRRATPLSEATYVPRGGTPLLDATGRIIARATAREQKRRIQGKRPEVTTIITITDGEENQSHEFTRQAIAALVKDREAAGWSFVFLGAGIDAYGEAGGIGVSAASTQAWAPNPAGARKAFASVGGAMLERRRKIRAEEDYAVADFFEGNKEAEAHRDAGGA